MKIDSIPNVYMSMKKIVLSLILIIILITSCSKSKPNNYVPLGTISANIDGVPITFSVNAIADTSTTFFAFGQYSYNIYINGFQDQTGTSNKLTVWLTNVPAAPIGIGTYPNNPIYCYFFYTKVPFVYQNNGFAPYISTVTITSIDSTSIQGIFSGQVIITEDSTSENPPLSYNITNGKFNVAFEH
jgi:hypothetical protein